MTQKQQVQTLIYLVSKWHVEIKMCSSFLCLLIPVGLYHEQVPEGLTTIQWVPV